MPNNLFRNLFLIMLLAIVCLKCNQKETKTSNELIAELDQEAETISIFRSGESDPIVVQNARQEFRPYLHPIAAPDGNGFVTEYSPGHHKHQTGLYWGFTRVNGEAAPQDSIKKWFYNPNKNEAQKRRQGRDFFHNPGEGFWKRIGFEVIDSKGESVSWKTVYHMLDEAGYPILEETQEWLAKESDGQIQLELTWKGKAIEEITIGEFEYGGMFLRMPWKEGIEGQAVNFARQINERAEGQRALWVDVAMQVEGRDDLAHVAIFDHPENQGFPQTWRVDGQLGVGPVRARMGDWKIFKGETETIKHGIVVYTGVLNDLELTETWKTYIGDDNLYATAGLWDIARQEGHAAEFLTAEQAVDEMTIKDGFEVNAWASEPMITQPMAFCYDDKGRIWVAENRDYETRSTGFSGSGDSKILILEDSDGDGTADKRTVFAEGIPFPSAIAVGFDGVFVGAPPNLLFIPDENRDDKADSKPEVLLTGWGIRDRHETINSFHWGPDGWLYGTEGFATPSVIRKPEGEGKLYAHNDPFPEDLFEADGVDINGGVWRYHPTKKVFEAVAHGFSNPWGIDYDAKGQLFISACVIPHLFHVIPGGIYHRQGGQHFNAHAYDDIKTIVDHRHRSAHGGARIYQSDAFPADERGKVFMANIHEHAVLSDVLTQKGSGFVASHGDDFMHANNAQWVGFSLEIGPDGGLYVLDWHDADICGDDVMNKDTGRIFRIMPKNSQAEEWEGRYGDLSLMSDLELANLQDSKSSWHSRRARVILQTRAQKGAIQEEAHAALQSMYADHASIDVRLQAMWALHVSNGLTVDDLLMSLDDQNEYIRAWGIQLVTEDKSVNEAVGQKMVELATSDPSPVVRLYLAAALQRVDEELGWRLAAELVQRAGDEEDHNIPKMIWFGLEPLMAKNPSKGLELVDNSQLTRITEYISRRAAAAGIADVLLATVKADRKNRSLLLRGLQSAIESDPQFQKPDTWDDTYEALKDDSSIGSLLTEIAQQLGDTEASVKLMAIVEDESADLAERRGAIKNLASKQWKGLRDKMWDLIEVQELRIEVIRAVAEYADEDLGWMIFENYEGFSEDEKTEAVMTMASRREYAYNLVEAIQEEIIPRSDIPIYVARQLRRVMGNGFVEIWGPIDDISADVEADYAKYKALLTEEAIASGDLLNGKTLFMNTCGPCHQMNGEGGILGPDLTGSNRTNVDYLLNNMIEPNAVIQDEYKMVVITTRDGRTFLGNVSGETDRQMTLRVVGQDEVVINKSEIQSQEVTPNSMMPPGMLNTLKEQEVIDLVAYLGELEVN